MLKLEIIHISDTHLRLSISSRKFIVYKYIYRGTPKKESYLDYKISKRFHQHFDIRLPGNEIPLRPERYCVRPQTYVSLYKSHFSHRNK